MTQSELLKKCQEFVKECLPEWNDLEVDEVTRRVFNSLAGHIRGP